MKSLKNTSSLAMTLFLLFFVVPAFAMNSEEEAIDTTQYNVFSGTVVNTSNARSLPFATVEAVGSGIATVTNIDGDFIIKLDKNALVSQLKISYIGFNTEFVDLSSFRPGQSKKIGLTASSVMLKEVTIRPSDALDLIGDAMYARKKNYPSEPMMMRGFYRETIQRGRNYTSISEAVVDIYKASYNNDFQLDQVKLFKGRKSADVERMDTVLFKMQGGPSTTILLDIMKNPYILLSESYSEIYNFEMNEVVSVDDRLHYVVSFRQKDHIDDPYYMGKLYIQMDNLAITEAEFELNTANQEEAARLFIQRKPMGMTVIPERAAYRTKYTVEGDTWYFSYARAEVKFKVNWKKKLFNTTYNTMSEIAITDRSTQGIEKFAGRERFKTHDVLNDKVYVFFDQDFWAGYNVIEPDQSIESAIKRLNRRFLKRN